MHRTTLIIDQPLLKEAVRVLGARTQSDAVNRALQEAVRMAKVHALSELFGSGVWEGDLASMRRDRPRVKRRRKK